MLLLLLLLYLTPGVTWPSVSDKLQCGYRVACVGSRRIIYIQVCLARLPVQASLNGGQGRCHLLKNRKKTLCRALAPVAECVAATTGKRRQWSKPF